MCKIHGIPHGPIAYADDSSAFLFGVIDLDLGTLPVRMVLIGPLTPQFGLRGVEYR